MNSNSWGQISEILVDCLEVEPAKREEYLDSLEIGSELRKEVETFLALEENVEGTMNFSAIEYSKDFIDDESAATGQQFGAYKVIGELGHGGMGTVYLAERTDGKFSQRVALKLLKREMNTAAIRRRFEQERKFLPLLSIRTLRDY